MLTEKDLDTVVDLTLEETDTIWMLDIPTVCVATDSEEAQSVMERNDRYREVEHKPAGCSEMIAQLILLSGQLISLSFLQLLLTIETVFTNFK